MFKRIRTLLTAQLLLVAVTSVVFLSGSGGFQAGSVWFGGMIATCNVLLLEWRRYRADNARAMDARGSLVVLYRSALERFAVVALLFAAGMGVLQLAPLALLSGFIAGQAGLIFTGTGKTD